MKCKNSCGKRKREGSGCQAVREENGERRGRQGRLGGVSRLKVVWRWQRFDKAWGWNFRKEGEGKTGR